MCMGAQQWKTLSVKVSEQEENALKLLCEKRGVKKHAIMKELLRREIEPLTKPGAIIEGEGLPLVGDHIFKYNAEKDNFTWQVDLGTHGLHALAENIPFSFVANLEVALHKAIDCRERMPRNKAIVPKSLLRYKVKKCLNQN